MPRKQIVTEDPDDEMEMEVEEEGEKLFPHLSEWAVENELNLPSQLKGQMKSRERRELLEYKRSHNEVEWEMHLAELIGEKQKELDIQRLKSKLQTTEDVPTTKAKAAPKKAAKAAPTRASRRRQIAEEEEEQDEEEGDEAQEEEDEDDLFDSDEEREISARNRSGLRSDSSALGKRKGKAAEGKTKKPKSRLDELDDEDGSEYEGSGDEEEGEYEGDAVDDRVSKKKEEEQDDSGPAEWKDYHAIVLRRDVLKNSVNEPYFKEAVVGQFVRFLVGSLELKDAAGNVKKDDDGNILKKDVYRMMEVIDVVENPSGTLDKFPTAKEYEPVVSTKKRLRLQYGSAEQDVRMSKLSNSRVTEVEFNKYLKEMRGVRGFKELTKLQVQRRRERLKKITTEHRYTKEEIDIMVRNCNKAGLVSGKIKFSGTTFVEALRALNAFREQAETDTERMEIDKDIQQLKNKKGQLDAAYLEQSRRQRHLNEFKFKENMRKDAQASKKAEQLLIAGGGGSDRIDPFVRRETRPRNLWVEGMKGKEQTAAEEGKAATKMQDAKQAAAAAAVKSAAAAAAARAGFDFLMTQEPTYMDAHRVHARVLDKLRHLIRPDLPDPLEEATKSQQQKYCEKLHKRFQGMQQNPHSTERRETYRQMICPESMSLWEYAAAHK